MTAALFLFSTLPTYHTRHFEYYGGTVPILNQSILRGVDQVQSKVPEDGGGYFIGVKADPPECPIGFTLDLFGKNLLQPTRQTSYCSGASYAAFIYGLSFALEGSTKELTSDQIEAIRMQEADGGRREDMVKLWGWWNADGPGSLYALTNFTSMGRRVSYFDAVAGDFCNINWVKGPGHSVVFLGWEETADGLPGMRFWSSQKSTNGVGDLTVPISSIAGVVFTRLTHADSIYDLNPSLTFERPKVDYDLLNPSFVSGQMRKHADPSSKIRSSVQL
jgi:hypothetical protein